MSEPLAALLDPQNAPARHGEWHPAHRPVAFGAVFLTDDDGCDLSVEPWEVAVMVNMAVDALAASERPPVDPLLVFGHAVGIALSDRKVPDDWDTDNLTPSQVIEGAARLLDRLDDATDAYLAAHGETEPTSRRMQHDLRALASPAVPPEGRNIVVDLPGNLLPLATLLHDDGEFSIEIAAMPGHVGAGHTFAEALGAAHDAALAWIDANRAAVPRPEGLDSDADEVHLARAATHLLTHLAVDAPMFYCEDTTNVRHFAAKILARLSDTGDTPDGAS